MHCRCLMYTLHSLSLAVFPSSTKTLTIGRPFRGPSMATNDQTIASAPGAQKKHAYSVWGVPPNDVAERLRTLMGGLRSEFGGPQFEPHVTVVGLMWLTEDEAFEKFRSACEGVKAYTAAVDRVATGTFSFQCVFLLLHPTPQVVETSAHCWEYFGYKTDTPYMPHLSLLYGDLTDEEKKKAQERANILDESINSLTFQISRLELWKTDTGDNSLKSWEKAAEFCLSPN